MLTLTYGYQKPQQDDLGPVVFPALSGNAQLQNDHVHDGTLGKVNPAATVAVPAASWTATAGQPGTYQQTVTVPANWNYDTCAVTIKLSTGEVIHPSITRVSSTQFVVFVNDNTLNLTAVFSS